MLKMDLFEKLVDPTIGVPVSGNKGRGYGRLFHTSLQVQSSNLSIVLDKTQVIH